MTRLAESAAFFLRAAEGCEAKARYHDDEARKQRKLAAEYRERAERLSHD